MERDNNTEQQAIIKSTVGRASVGALSTTDGSGRRISVHRAIQFWEAQGTENGTAQGSEKGSPERRRETRKQLRKEGPIECWKFDTKIPMVHI
jgi:hypothetical protein